jgi:hypothetical protein
MKMNGYSGKQVPIIGGLGFNVSNLICMLVTWRRCHLGRQSVPAKWLLYDSLFLSD